MNKKDHPVAVDARAEQLRNIVGDLAEVHSLLQLLCTQLAGGGIVEARQLEPVVAEAEPKLRRIVDTMSALSDEGSPRVEVRRSRAPKSGNPLLM